METKEKGWEFEPGYTMRTGRYCENMALFLKEEKEPISVAALGVKRTSVFCEGKSRIEAMASPQHDPALALETYWWNQTYATGDGCGFLSSDKSVFIDLDAPLLRMPIHPESYPSHPDFHKSPRVFYKNGFHLPDGYVEGRRSQLYFLTRKQVEAITGKGYTYQENGKKKGWRAEHPLVQKTWEFLFRGKGLEEYIKTVDHRYERYGFRPQKIMTFEFRHYFRGRFHLFSSRVERSLPPMDLMQFWTIGQQFPCGDAVTSMATTGYDVGAPDSVVEVTLLGVTKEVSMR